MKIWSMWPQHNNMCISWKILVVDEEDTWVSELRLSSSPQVELGGHVSAKEHQDPRRCSGAQGTSCYIDLPSALLFFTQKPSVKNKNEKK